MKIQLVSDIHVEFDDDAAPFHLPEVERDVLVVAGDLGEGINGTEFLMRELARSPVVYVLGNHEFYQHYYQNIRKHWKAQHGKLRVRENPLWVLDDTAVTISGVRFIGSTLWADFDRNSPLTKLAAMNGMSDFSCIGFEEPDGGERILLPDDTYDAHTKGRAFIARELAANHKRSVVVSHHAPSQRSIPVGYRHDSMNGCYVSNLEELIEAHQPDAWCHGHTHVVQDYLLGKTRVLCNPRGYSGYEPTRGFDPSFTFDV